MSKLAVIDTHRPEPKRVFAGDGINSGWKVTLDDHLAAIERAKDEERLAILSQIEAWSQGRNFVEQGVASLLLNDLIKGEV